MDTKRLARRNSSLDIVRIVAVFTVLSVHFFLHNGFYSEPVSGMGPIEGVISFFQTGNYGDLHGPQMYVMVLMRTLFGVCVPLFMILTGYLMSKKELSRGYYKGIKKTLMMFVLATIACMVFKAVHNNPTAYNAFYNFNLETLFSSVGNSGDLTLSEYILRTLDFTGANYSWYIEMYIGLFLMAPFLNLGFNKLKSKRQRQVLVATFLFLTMVPTVFNIFNFDTATWWTTPTENDTYQKLIPAFWMGVYPITYYFIGAYLREYGIRLRTRSVAALFAVSLFLFGTFSWFRSYGGGFKSSAYVYWYGFAPGILATLLFVLLSRIKTDNWKPGVKLALWKLSDLALGIYLLSYIFDEIIYKVLREEVPVMVDRLPWYLVTVPLCFICATALSFLLNLLGKGLFALYEQIKQFVIAQRARKDKKKWQDFLFIALFVAALIFSIWKLSYGFGGNDEAFYLTIPHRLTMGDAMFADEWHLSQLSGFLLLPFVWLFTTITGSTEGIMLAARIVYLIFHAGAAVLIYSRIRKYGYLSVFASVLYFLFVPYNIMALSYDSMGLELVTLTGVLLATADYDKKLQIIFSGLCFAGAVLCNPYLAAVWALYGVCVLLHVLLRKKDWRFVLKSRLFAPKTFLFFTAGVAALAVVFLIFTLTRVGFSDIFSNLPYMLTDPEHPQIPFGTRLTSYFKCIFELHPHFRYAVYAYGATLLAMLIDRKRRLHRSVYLIITTAVVIYTYVLLLPNLHYSTYNAIMFPMLFIGVTSYILCERKPRELFAALFVLGILYSLCMHFTSNQYFYIISTAMTAANVASYLFLGQLIREMQETPDNITYAVWVKRFSLVFAALMIFLQGAFQIGSKAQHVFWDSDPDSLTAEIEAGPAAGLRTTPANAAAYEALYNDVTQFVNSTGGYRDNVLFLTKRTWMYLAAYDFPYGTFSAWLSGERDSSLQRLDTFYSVNPDKQPKFVYIPKDSDWNIDPLLNSWKAKGYQLSETDLSYRLIRY